MLTNMNLLRDDIRKRLKGPAPDIRGLTAAVIGMGESGAAVCELLLKDGANILAFDSDSNKVQSLRETWEPKGVSLTSEPFSSVDSIDFGIISPGVPPSIPVCRHLREARIPVIGEMEFACRYITRPMIAITGTNGKTTVTHMVSFILNRLGVNTEPVGNVGKPISTVVVEEKHLGIEPLAVEVSSYQCETFDEFKPVCAVITSLAPDHLDRYESVEEYYETKFKVCRNQAPHEALWMGPRVEGSCPAWVRSRKKSFAMNALGSEGIFYLDRTVVWRDGEREERLACPSFEQYPIQQGLNALAAVGAAVSLGYPLADSFQAIQTFQALPHRLEYVAEVNGIRCYNDSKATNVHAVEAALHSLNGPIRLIAGGRPKGDSLAPLEPLIREKVVSVYLIGEAAQQFADEWKSITDVFIEKTLEEAVAHGLRDGRPGDILLLSPACASWDMFKNYGERGDRFKQAVKEWNG